MDTRISEAIIMRVRDFGESDLMVSFFTTDQGRLTGVAKGGRRSRRRFSNCLDLFCLTSLEYGQRRKGDLVMLESGRLINGFAGLRSDFATLSLASYLTELTEILFPQNLTDPAMFELLRDSFAAIEEGMYTEAIRIYFEARAMTLGGYRINLERCARCGRAYTGAGMAVFMRTKGGIACLNCERPSPDNPAIGPVAASILCKMQSEPWKNIDVTLLTTDLISEIRPVVKRHMEFRLGRSLKSSRYLQL
ncbi:DNA repair protein RecO [uncultured Desulfobacterium sp.]|uniref:DNA repair protein RecO n=1 Tax=uncultured Desulfobacterium sp. TaxID=201089 RepID=A0A445MV19_9BACT|nr:DNA repair protein RecO [uncultured Desulfobacterium sp.]